jgi:hypothetical protein
MDPLSRLWRLILPENIGNGGDEWLLRLVPTFSINLSYEGFFMLRVGWRPAPIRRRRAS